MYKFLFYLLLTVVITCLAIYVVPFHMVLAIYLFGVMFTLFISSDLEELENE
ncbi:hypothetical protein [Staphylococcus sp. HMSC065C10]|uniref:hypothetical protein n=1 Tax=Staphylococcus sp. HMSC065C10 TaxID=1739325 RepID=UPI00159F5D8B|nr:hypothetical protein [Staphylococcus sp. HMSC065C10]